MLTISEITTPEQAKQINKINNAIKSFNNDPDIIAIVKDIETGIKTTQDNYGKYMQFLGTMPDKVTRYIMSEALINNGGNYNGIKSALQILG